MEDESVFEEPEEETSEPQNVPPAAEQGPLVSVTFQTDSHRKLKYLESQPKALGMTQITFGVLKIFAYATFFIFGLEIFTIQIFKLLETVLVIVAGSLALVAQNLHLPTLKACLGMQVVSSMVSALNLAADGAQFGVGGRICWLLVHPNATVQHDACNMLSTVLDHYTAQNILIQAALLAISVTLAAYCCKVVNCCSPASSMAVISVQAPPTQ